MIASQRSVQVGDRQSSKAEQEFLCLLNQARGGTTEALGELFAAQWPALLVVAHSSLDHRLAAKLSAEDLGQETVLEAQLGLHQFRGWRQIEFAAWLKAILLNRLSNSVRHFRRTKRRDIDRELPQAAVEAAIAATCDSRATPNIEAELLETRSQLSAGICRMAPLARAVVLERACHGASFREIGLRHHCSPKVARRHWTEGLRELQRHMNSAKSIGRIARGRRVV